MNEEVTKTIQKIAKRLAPKYTFGFYDVDDIIQEAFIIGMKIYTEEYDGKRPLENFLTVSINNRLKNFKRNHCGRVEPKDKESEEWDRWNNNYSSKLNLLNPISFQKVNDDNESSMYTSIDFINLLEIQEILILIDRELPIELRADYLRLKCYYEDPKCNVSLDKSKRQRIEDEIISILERNGHEVW